MSSRFKKVSVARSMAFGGCLLLLGSCVAAEEELLLPATEAVALGTQGELNPAEAETNRAAGERLFEPEMDPVAIRHGKETASAMRRYLQRTRLRDPKSKTDDTIEYKANGSWFTQDFGNIDDFLEELAEQNAKALAAQLEHPYAQPPITPPPEVPPEYRDMWTKYAFASRNLNAETGLRDYWFQNLDLHFRNGTLRDFFRALSDQ